MRDTFFEIKKQLKLQLPVKGLALAILLITMSVAVFAQRPAERGDKLESLRVSFITEKLNLTPDEAEKFWPVYNEYHDKMREVSGRGKGSEKANFETMSDAEIATWLDDQIEKEKKVIELRGEYIGKFKQVLPTRKVALLLKVEKDFRVKMLQIMRERSSKGKMAPQRSPRKRF